MKGISAYRENAVTTQSRGRVIVLLYDGAIKFLRQAVDCLQREDWAGKGVYINKAVAVIDELDVSLDMENGGEIAENLRRLYDFMRRRLSQANMQRDAKGVRDVITLLEDLSGAWKAIAE